MEPYRERIAWPLWVHLLLLVPVGLGVYGVGKYLVRGERGIGALVVPAGLLCVGFVWWRMRHLALEVGREAIAFGFGGLRRRVPRARILSLAEEEYSPLAYMGWGYRIGWAARDRAYSVVGCRRGLRVVFLDDRERTWQVFLACTDPGAALAAFDA